SNSVGSSPGSGGSASESEVAGGMGRVVGMVAIAPSLPRRSRVRDRQSGAEEHGPVALDETLRGEIAERRLDRDAIVRADGRPQLDPARFVAQPVEDPAPEPARRRREGRRRLSGGSAGASPGRDM